jgi:D-alanine-D-alanine ligase
LKNTESSSLKCDAPFVLLFGGVGCEREVSQRGAYNILTLADRVGAPCIPVGIDKRGYWYLYRGEAENIRSGFWAGDKDRLIPVFIRKSDGAYLFGSDFKIAVKGFFPLLHGNFGEDGIVQGALEAAGLPFVGARTLCGALATDKAAGKILAASVGIPTLPYVLYLGGKDDCRCGNLALSKKEAFRQAEALGLPVFIKPSGLGSSIGAGVARSEGEFYERLEEAEKLGDGRVLIESYLPGRRELECAYFESSAGVVITPPGEAVCNKEFYDFHEKYESGEVRLYSKSPLSDDISEKLIEYTKILSRLFGLRHIGRVDFFLADEKKIYFNEVNPTPGLTESSLYLGMLGAAGVSSEEFVFSIERWLREAAV